MEDLTHADLQQQQLAAYQSHGVQEPAELGKRTHEEMVAQGGEAQMMQSYETEITKRRGRPKGRTALNSFIENGVERRKYFVNRIKAMRSKAENFAYCTNSEMLLLAIDESGMCHHWETEGMGRFINDAQIQDAMFQVVCQNHGAPPPDEQAEANSIHQVAQIKAQRLAGTGQPMPQQSAEVSMQQAAEEAEHLRSLLRQKVAMMPMPDGLARIYGNEEHRPAEWLASVPFVEPAQLDHGTLLAVLQQFVAYEQAYQAQAQGHMQASDQQSIQSISHEQMAQLHEQQLAQQQQFNELDLQQQSQQPPHIFEAD